METSLIIAKIIGVIYLAFGLGLIFNRAYYKQAFTKMMEDSTYTILSGFMAIILGFIVVEYHPGSTEDWTIIITIIGWIAIVKGILLLAIPKSFNVFQSIFEKNSSLNIMTFFVFVFGLIFINLGFFMTS